MVLAEAEPGLGAGCQWEGCWKMVSSNRGCGQFQFLQPRAGLSLGVFWAASFLWWSEQLWMRAAAVQRRLVISGDIYTSATVAVNL